MFAKSGDLLAAAAAGLLFGAALWSGAASGLLRVPFGLALLLFLPGYVWVAALFPRGALRTAERVALTPGLSMALAIAGGLLLNASPWGLRTSSWAVWSASVVLLGALAALIRRARGVGMPALVRSGPPVRPPEAFLFGLAVLLAASAGFIGWRAAAKQEAADFTQFWLRQRSASSVEIGMANLEQGAVAYRVEVRLGETLLVQQSPIGLRPGERWQTTVTLPTNSDTRTVQALLFRLDQPAKPYRRTELWLRRAPAH